MNFLKFILLSVVTLTTYNNCSKPMHSIGGSNSSLSQQAAFKCTDRNLSSETKNYLLSKNQYINTIQDLFGTGASAAVSAQISTILADSNAIDDHQRLTTISSSQAIAYYDTASALANYIVGNTTQVANVFGACANQATPPATCIDTYLNGFATRILRRPLNSSEIAFAKQIMSTSGTYKENLKAVLTYHLFSPSFLWLLELGTQNSSGRRLALTPYEVATRLSYLITDSTPDNQLLTSASNGSIMTPLGLQSQVQRLLKTNRGRQKVINNFLRWSLTDTATDITNLPAQLLNGIQTNGLQTAMLSEVKTFADHILYNTNGSLKELVTSKLSFASHPGLAAIYGHTPMVNSPVVMTERRQGILLRAPAMTTTNTTTSIILRGVHFLNRVLCNEIPPPNVNIANDRSAHVLSAQELLTVTNRAAVTYQTESPVCMSCHRMINPVGFAFEGFDSLGKIRNQELKFDTNNTLVGNLPIHTDTVIPMPSGQNLSVGDAYDMVSQLADSPELAACLTKNSFRYFYEKRETKEDDCQLQDSFDVIKNDSNSALSAIEKIFNSNAIYYKEL